MKTTYVKEVMVPLSDYTVVNTEATLQDAVFALKTAREAFHTHSTHHRTVLVVDSQQRVVGKISQLDLVKGLEDGYAKIGEVKGVDHFGYDARLIKSIMDQARLWERPLNDLCRKRADIKVKTIMNIPKDREYIEATATLDEAIHQMVMTRHHSLLVAENGEVVGVLRLEEIFELVDREMAACKDLAEAC